MRSRNSGTCVQLAKQDMVDAETALAELGIVLSKIEPPPAPPVSLRWRALVPDPLRIHPAAHARPVGRITNNGSGFILTLPPGRPNLEVVSMFRVPLWFVCAWPAAVVPPTQRWRRSQYCNGWVWPVHQRAERVTAYNS